MASSMIEAGARSFVVNFLQDYIATGTLILMEDGGAVFTFEGTREKSSLNVSLEVHNPRFYWKIFTKASLGLADAYIHGDFSVVDKNEGLLNMLMIFSPRFSKRRWWTPMFLTASAKYFYNYVVYGVREWWIPVVQTAPAKYFYNVMGKYTATRADVNISDEHYDLSNEFFSLFLDETMSYSCAIFKSDDDEDLKTAQMRKISSLIEKARVDKDDDVLDIGCGWGALAIELVKQTGCKYTGITISKEQIEYAESKVKEADLQDRIRFLLCDYRQLPDTRKYDRIIGCEVMEHVGHEHYEEFFGCCESTLAEDGIMVLQFTTVPDEKYDKFRKRPDFMKEYVFPGINLPSLSRLTSAMAASSRLCVDHVEKLGTTHYFQTLRCWRANFLKNQSKILSLGFNQEFIRTWEYDFDYCAAGFKLGIVMNYQVVFSRPGNISPTPGMSSLMGNVN